MWRYDSKKMMIMLLCGKKHSDNLDILSKRDSYMHACIFCHAVLLLQCLCAKKQKTKILHFFAVNGILIVVPLSLLLHRFLHVHSHSLSDSIYYTLLLLWCHANATIIVCLFKEGWARTKKEIWKKTAVAAAERKAKLYTLLIISICQNVVHAEYFA